MSDESSNDKETVPPPPGDEVDEHEATVVSARPDKLLAELARAGQGADRGEPGEPASGRPGPTSEGGGLRQMFARNPMHIRDVLPTEAEGDALLDMLFDDGHGKQVWHDLTRYATTSFIVKCVPANTLTLTIPTFDPTTSRRDDMLSYRIMSAFFKCNEKPSRVVIDLTRMETQQWWFDMFKTDLSSHHYRLDQVPKFAFGSTLQSPMNTHSEVEIRELQLNGRDYRYPIVTAIILVIGWSIFGVWFFRAHTRALVAHLNSRMQRDLPLIAYQQLSMEPHRDKEKAAILRHMAMHYTNPDIDVESVAREVGVTRGKINDVLKNEFGFTFSGYLNKLRLTEAARLLAEKDSATVAEIAYSVGYSNVSYFNKLFKEEYGSTPKAFRVVARA